jgi:predicted DNA-binding mobile mystery protein A
MTLRKRKQSQSSSTRRLRIEQLGRALVALRKARPRQVPKGGWIAEIRSVLGMTVEQFARRVGVSKTTALSYQRNEVAESITLQSLRRSAEALNCDLLYTLVPKKNLTETLNDRIREKAIARVSALSVTMALEAQATDASFNKRQLDDLIAEWQQKPPADLWD